jgi:subtilase family serine protease
LIITDITFSPYPPKKGQAVTVKVSSYNQGNAAAGAYTVRWWPGENYPAPACTWNIGGMVANGGQVHTCVYAGYPSSYGSINTKAVVDTNNTVAESNEGNNTMIKGISVSN